MIYTEATKRAARICVQAHAGQLDKGGYPYCMHPIHLAEQMDDEDSCCVALLHDVIEDCEGYDFAYLEENGFSPKVIEALRLLTHEEGVPYMDYVAAIAENPLARKVKMADLRHNMDVSRTNKTPRKYETYKEALAYLERKENA